MPRKSVSGAPRVGAGFSPRRSAGDQLAGALDVLLVVELVVDGDDRRVVAGRQALGVLEGDRAVGGGLVVADAEVAR